MSRKYFTLATRNGDKRWYPQFGDYDRGIVVQEKQDTYARDYRGKDMKIIVSGDTQPEIERALAHLNGDTGGWL